VKTARTPAAIAQGADGVVVGSALVDALKARSMRTGAQPRVRSRPSRAWSRNWPRACARSTRRARPDGLELGPPFAYLLPMAEPNNLVLAHLRELRADIGEWRAEMNTRFEAVESRLNRIGNRLDLMDKRMDAMHRNGEKALRGFIGHRATVERTMASFEDEFSYLVRRVEEFEAART
jgi:hypothetical protein